MRSHVSSVNHTSAISTSTLQVDPRLLGTMCIKPWVHAFKNTPYIDSLTICPPDSDSTILLLSFESSPAYNRHFLSRFFSKAILRGI